MDSSNPVNNNGGTINPVYKHTTGNNYRPVESATVNIGATKPISNGNFCNDMDSGQYIVKSLTGQSIAGVYLPGIGVITTASE